jgi:pimeloyl-ACP methyl ester carboxylesterase
MLAVLAAVLGGPGLAAAGAVAGPDLFLEQDGVKLRFIDRGQGEPVVLLHGFSLSADGWSTPWGGPDRPKILATLAERFRVIAIDARGHGRSDKPHDCAAYGAAMADDVVRVLDALRIPRAHLVGFSMGGLTAVQLVARHPERFRSVVLLAPKPELEEALVDGRDPSMDDIAAGLERGEGLAGLIHALTPPGVPPPSDAEVRAQSDAIMQGQDAQALACAARSFGGLAVKGSELDRVKAPVLMMVGSIDPLAPAVKALHAHVRSSRLVVVEGAAHITLLSAPRLLPELTGFLWAHPIR